MSTIITLPQAHQYTEQLQAIYEHLLYNTQREGVTSLLAIFQENGFYSSRCGRHHHFVGGTMQHSLETLLYMLSHNSDHLPEESIIVVALLHDVCNIHGFQHIRRHGSRSVRIITKEAGFRLTNDEYQAILWHMHGHKDQDRLGETFSQCLNSNRLHALLRRADKHSAGHPMARSALAAACNAYCAYRAFCAETGC